MLIISIRLVGETLLENLKYFWLQKSRYDIPAEVVYKNTPFRGTKIIADCFAAMFFRSVLSPDKSVKQEAGWPKTYFCGMLNMRSM